jgi:chromosome segregation ATPase
MDTKIAKLKAELAEKQEQVARLQGTHTELQQKHGDAKMLLRDMKDGVARKGFELQDAQERIVETERLLAQEQGVHNSLKEQLALDKKKLEVLTRENAEKQTLYDEKNSEVEGHQALLEVRVPI